MLQRFLIALISFGFFCSAPATADVDSDTQFNYAETWGGEVPFPFGTEIPFPWRSMQGIWATQNHAMDALFSFQVQLDDSGVKVLRVIHLDRATRRVVGQGAGFANSEQKVVRAVMRAMDGTSYLIFVRVFKDLNKKSAASHNSTVLTFRSLTLPDKEDQHMLLRKVSAKPYGVR